MARGEAVIFCAYVGLDLAFQGRLGRYRVITREPGETFNRKQARSGVWKNP